MLPANKPADSVKSIMQLSNNPPKGTYDWMPDEYRIRKYIFDIWRKVCVSFGYEEYLTPIFEHADIYRAKSGEDIGGKELMFFTDRAGRELAIRPEMTPSVTRMVSKTYGGASKPLRLFSIANFVRNEKPQRGRNREFWQLNFDVFGSRELSADIEFVQIVLEIMQAFNPPAGAYKVFLNHRKLIDFVLIELAKVPTESITSVVRILDKSLKLGAAEFSNRLSELGLDSTQIEILSKFVSANTESELAQLLPSILDSQGFKEIKQVMETVRELGFADVLAFRPNVIRGFDYYDGLVLEVFDMHPDNQRAMFGGGRYDGLGKLFGVEDLPAVGGAPGDETTRIFLESWGLLEQVKVNQPASMYFPLLDESLQKEQFLLAKKLREMGQNVVAGLEVQKIGKALEFANKKAFSKVIILGTQEKDAGSYKVKDMESGGEEVHKW